jgi:protease-4
MGTWTAYLASACNRVVLPESAAIFAAGLRAEATFLADTLALLGVQPELEACGEYKVSPDTFRRSSPSRPHREMLEAILDSDFEEVVQGIAEGRGLAPEQVRALMDRMPLSVQEAVEVGLVDGVLYEDELEQDLGEEGRPAPLATWAEAHRWLRWPVRWRRRPSIGIVSVEGTIVPGRSRRLPPVPFPLPLLEQQAGSDTVCQTLRAAERQRGIAAVILYVDSPGGSSLASDLIWREVRRLRERKPVVVLMGNRAASGAYYIAAPANAIIAQPTTLTGSIGVWGGKFVTAGLFERLRVGREVFRRGARAALWDDTAPFTEEERQAVRRELEDSYRRFKARVAEGRSMEPVQVEEIGRGRIWTGRQALELGLVDELGGFETALERAKELAGLDPRRWYPVVTVTAPRQFRPPLAFPTPEGTLATLAHSLRVLGEERVWALLPWAIRIWG